MIYDFLFEFTEYSDNEGEQILVECGTVRDAWNILIDDYKFSNKELHYIERMSVEEGEMLGLDTY